MNATNLRRFCKRLHHDERATVSVEWMLVISVALIVLAGVYYVCSWAVDSTSDAIDKVTSK